MKSLNFGQILSKNVSKIIKRFQSSYTKNIIQQKNLFTQIYHLVFLYSLILRKIKTVMKSK